MSTSTEFEQPYLRLLRFILRAKHEVIAHGTDLGLNGMQTMVIMFLDSPRPMHSFKKLFNCDASYITGIVDSLEEKELVSRFEDPADRRVKMIRLEPDGHAMRNTLFRSINHAGGPVFSNLTPEEMQTFTTLLDKVTRAETEN